MQISYSLNEIETVAAQLNELFKSYSILTFTGTLGAGKTTLIRSMLLQMGVKETITSPTFTYVNAYHLATGKTVYHFDLYRIKSVDDFVASGFDEYLYADDSLCVIEWPEVIMPLLRTSVCHCTIEYAELGRVLTCGCIT